MNVRRWSVVCLVAAITAIVACSTTKISKTWKAPNYQAGSMNKIVVVALAERVRIRQYMEEEFCDQLKARGLEAIPSYRFMTLDSKTPREVLAAKMRELGADGVIVVKLVGRRMTTTFAGESIWWTPSDFDTPYEDYVIGELGASIYTYDTEIISTETRLFSVATEKPVWTAWAETFRQQESETDLIRTLIAKVIGALTSDGLIK